MAKMTKEEKVVAFRYAIASLGNVIRHPRITLPHVSIQHKEETNDEEARNTADKQGRSSSAD